MSAKGPRAWQAGTRALVLATIVASAASWMIAAMGFFSFVTVGAPAGVDGAAHIVVVAETLMYQDGRGLPAAWRCLVNGRVLGGAHRGCALAGIGLASSRQ